MKLGNFTSPDIGAVAKDKIAVLPIGAFEQHGNHLPVITDTAIVDELSERLDQKFYEQLMILPPLWCGSSHHHLSFPGTLSIAASTYVDVLCDLCRSLVKSGFSKILLLNGHGGNHVPASMAIARLGLEYEAEQNPPWIVLGTYWRIASEAIATQTFMSSPSLTHACEYETSMMLALKAEWVQMSRAVGRQPTRHSKYYDPLNYKPSRAFAGETFKQMTDTGALGSPEMASPEKGRALLDLITDQLFGFILDFSTWKQ